MNERTNEQVKRAVSMDSLVSAPPCSPALQCTAPRKALRRRGSSMTLGSCVSRLSWLPEAPRGPGDAVSGSTPCGLSLTCCTLQHDAAIPDI